MLETIKNRHSVRQFKDIAIEEEKRKELDTLIKQINKKSGLNIQSCYDEPEAFNTFMAHYGKFKNTKNYIVLIGKKKQDEQIGYYGEQIVIKAQELGLNTCWVALTYGKKKTKITKAKGEKIYCTIALGYGETSGTPHKSKTIDQVSNISDNTPEWFKTGVEYALLAPTAMNQQKFKFTYQDDQVLASSGNGFYTKIDLGIAKYHFELGAKEKIDWKN